MLDLPLYVNRKVYFVTDDGGQGLLQTGWTLGGAGWFLLPNIN